VHLQRQPRRGLHLRPLELVRTVSKPPPLRQDDHCVSHHLQGDRLDFEADDEGLVHPLAGWKLGDFAVVVLAVRRHTDVQRAQSGRSGSGVWTAVHNSFLSGSNFFSLKRSTTLKQSSKNSGRVSQ